MHKLFLTVIFLIFINYSSYSEGRKLLLADTNKCLNIYINELADNAFIVKELNLHFLKLTGKKPLIVKKGEIDKPVSTLLLDIKREMPDDSYEVAVKGNNLCISGGNTRGLYYGVIAFLEHLGCRWYAPGEIGEVIPKITRIEVADNFCVKGSPSVPWRGLHICGYGVTRDGARKGHWDYETALWMIRNKMNFKPIHNSEYEDVNPLLQKILLKPLAFGHSYSKWFPQEEFAKHPEYFAMVNGKRLQNGQLCLSNSDMRKELARRIVEYAEKHPDLPVISLAPNDGYRWCECPDCIKLDTPEDREKGEINQRTHWFNVEIARELKKTNPDITISGIAYCNYLEPGSNIAKTDNFVVVICETKAQNYSLNNDKSPSNNIIRKRFLRWRETAGKVVWSSYYLSYGGTFPRPYGVQLAKTIRFLAENKLYGFKSEVVPGNNDRWRSAIYYIYLFSRLLYDSKSDPDKVLDDFCQKFYGPAAESCRKYYLINREAVAGYEKELPSIGFSVLPELYSDDYIGSLESAVLTAEKAVGDDNVYSKRVALLRKQLDEIKSSREAMKECIVESKPLIVKNVSSDPGWDIMRNLEWTNMRQRSNCLQFAPPSYFAVRRGEKKLWLFFRLGEKDMSFLSRNKATANGGFSGSNIDLFFSPEPESEIYYQLAVNYAGKYYSAKCKGRMWDSSYDLKPQIKVRCLNDRWEMILGIDYSLLNTAKPAKGKSWHVAFNRGQICDSPRILGGWPKSGVWHNIKNMGFLKF